MRYGRIVPGLLLAAVVHGCTAESAKDTRGERGLADSTALAPPGSSGAGEAGNRDVRRQVLIVGTSLTAGLGLDPDEAYPALVQQKVDSAGLPFLVVAAGLSGETSAGALRRIEWLLKAPLPAVIIVETGANDGLRGLDVDSTRENLRAIVRRLKALVPSATILLAQMESPPNLGERYTSRFRAMFPEVAREERVTLLPFLLDSVAGIPALNQADGIHPNPRGSVIVARNVWRSLEPVLKRAALPP